MSDLYDIDVETFSQVLDENLNYHYMESGELDNMFDNYTHNVLGYFKELNSLLDVGCGYGGPAKLIKRYLPDLEIECITNETDQHRHVSKHFTTHLTDAADFITDKQYDIVTFFDSLCHMEGIRTLENVSKYTSKMLIKDYTHFTEDVYYSSRWEMTFRSEANWRKVLSDAGFDIKIFGLNPKVRVKETHEFWREKLRSVESEKRQLTFLRELSSLNGLKSNKSHCLIYAEKA